MLIATIIAQVGSHADQLEKLERTARDEIKEWSKCEHSSRRDAHIFHRLNEALVAELAAFKQQRCLYCQSPLSASAINSFCPQNRPIAQAAAPAAPPQTALRTQLAASGFDSGLASAAPLRKAGSAPGFAASASAGAQQAYLQLQAERPSKQAGGGGLAARIAGQAGGLLPNSLPSSPTHAAAGSSPFVSADVASGQDLFSQHASATRAGSRPVSLRTDDRDIAAAHGVALAGGSNQRAPTIAAPASTSRTPFGAPGSGLHFFVFSPKTAS